MSQDVGWRAVQSCLFISTNPMAAGCELVLFMLMLLCVCEDHHAHAQGGLHILPSLSIFGASTSCPKTQPWPPHLVPPAPIRPIRPSPAFWTRYGWSVVSQPTRLPPIAPT